MPSAPAAAPHAPLGFTDCGPPPRRGATQARAQVEKRWGAELGLILLAHPYPSPALRTPQTLKLGWSAARPPWLATPRLAPAATPRRPRLPALGRLVALASGAPPAAPHPPPPTLHAHNVQEHLPERLPVHPVQHRQQAAPDMGQGRCGGWLAAWGGRAWRTKPPCAARGGGGWQGPAAPRAPMPRFPAACTSAASRLAPLPVSPPHPLLTPRSQCKTGTSSA